MLGKYVGNAAGGAIGKSVGKAAGVAGVAMKWPLLIAVGVWNILDSILGLFIKSPLWVFLILMLLDALVNIILIIIIVNGRSVFKLWIWDIILFGWASLSTLLNFFIGWWLLEWIVDPLLMIACCFLVALIPFDKDGGKAEQYTGEDTYSYNDTMVSKRTAAKRNAAVGSTPSADKPHQNGATIINIGSVSSDPLIKDDKE